MVAVLNQTASSCRRSAITMAGMATSSTGARAFVVGIATVNLGLTLSAGYGWFGEAVHLLLDALSEDSVDRVPVVVVH